jgi:3-deoxy-7-phosphoheptulonate synthase
MLTPSPWRARSSRQQPTYPDPAALDAALGHLATLPPLVTSWEVRALKTQLAEAAAGQRFLLQGGDCAESFAECTAPVITNRLKVLMQMSLVLTYGLRMRVTRVGRTAGQYAKPRSSDFETRAGVTLPSYRGDIINGPAFTAEDRTPDPARLVRAYARSAMTLNFVRALSQGGFADLHHPEVWDLDFVGHSPFSDEYHAIVGRIHDGLSFVTTLISDRISELERAEFYTSHEALLLGYEDALTRLVPRHETPYNLGTHFPWIGLRTNDPEGAHVAYAAGIANPVAVKVGGTTPPEHVRDLLRILNPEREPGRLTFIARFGADHVEDGLPRLIETVRASGYPVLWVCDPMHGNTVETATGIKTRRFESIVGELEASFRIHAAMGSHLGGVHLELTGENVTECTGGARGLDEEGLTRDYRSNVDPRLNADQALELALRIVRMYRR